MTITQLQYVLGPVFFETDVNIFYDYCENQYMHSLIYAVKVGKQKKTRNQKLRKLRLLSSTKGEENDI